MGVLAPVSAHAGPSNQPPIDTSGNFPARVSAESILAFKHPKFAFQGGRGVPEIFFSLECSYFCEYGAHAKNQNPTTPPYAILAMAVRVEKGGQDQHFIKCLPSTSPNQTCCLSQQEASSSLVWFANTLGRHLIKCSSCPLLPYRGGMLMRQSHIVRLSHLGRQPHVLRQPHLMRLPHPVRNL